jgi:transcriptional regulator with XRE-family HTH domain
MRGMDIASIRTGLGLTQAEFAQRLGISHAYVGHLEQGVRKPSLRLAARIEEVASVTGLVAAVVAEKTGRAA